MRCLTGFAICIGTLVVLASAAGAQAPHDTFGGNDDGDLDSGVDDFGDGDYETSLRYGVDRS